MFEGFTQTSAPSGKRWAASTGVGLGVCALIFTGVVFLATRKVVRERTEETIDVTFRSSVDDAPPPAAEPPPPPPPVVKQAAVQASAAKPAKRAAVRPASAPKAVPRSRPEEAEPTGPRHEEVALVDDAAEEAAPIVEEKAVVEEKPPGPVKEKEAEQAPPEKIERRAPPAPPVEEEDAAPVRARIASGNPPPEYPEEARRKGIEGVVVLKVSVSATGAVTGVRVLRGEEPFASAAQTVVKSWRFEPAIDDGRAVDGTCIVRIPFRLRS